MSESTDAELYAASDYSLFGPESLEDVQQRLARIDSNECRCGDSPHENALHDLAHDDAPALLRLVESLETKRAKVKALCERAIDVLENDGECHAEDLADQVLAAIARAT
ncbi:hypothetical protein MINTM005_13550 [Mycobacterium intracellulare]|uniref:hypothetical protein n=1 Tax=Mycobacterium intracellulare TaxID=1767 RepID=UPI0019263009|nr:hypothetical protein [Mycobacterium intracellulare]BCO56111.1 hypothetical protein MINTM005_13550 [Mycobacterium intracellulare]